MLYTYTQSRFQEGKLSKVMDQRQALDQFLCHVQKRAFQMARIATGCEQDALDIVQEAMITLIRNYSDKPEAEWQPLFYKVLQSKIYDHHRRGQLRHKWFGWLGFKGRDDDDEDTEHDPIQKAEDPASVSPERQLHLSQASAQLVEAVSRLPIRQQQAFLLRLWEGLSVADTAIAMAVSEGSVKTHYSRAIATLRSQLEGYW